MTVALRTVSGLDVTLDQKGIALAFGCDIVDPEGGRRGLAEAPSTLAEQESPGLIDFLPQPELVERAWVEL